MTKQKNSGKRQEGKWHTKGIWPHFLFKFVAMFVTMAIILETDSLSYKLLQHEERARSYTYNLPNITNPMVSTIQEGNYIFALKQVTSKTDRLNLVEEMRK